MKRTSNTTRKSTKTAPKAAKILESILLQVPQHGWTETALDAGVRDAGLGRKDVEKLFSNGVADVVQSFGEWIDAEMQKRVAHERGFSRMRVRDKVAFAVRARLEGLAPHREAMKRLMMWYAMPTHAVAGVKRLAKTADIIWQAAGDTSTDYNFYTKRLLLGAVMKTTMLFWLNDETPGHRATWEFLDRRISEVVRAGKAISLAREWTPSEIIEMVRKKASGF